MTSRRRTSRIRKRLRAAVGATPVFTADVGPGGFSAVLMRVPPPGTPVQGSIRVGEREVGFSGMVAWARPGDPHMALRGRVGVRFTSEPAGWNVMLAALALVGMA